MKKISLWITALFCSGLFACDSQRVYEENKDFEQKVWLSDSIPVFTFEIKQPELKYNIYYNIRNTVAYPYQNLYLTYYLEDTLGRQVSSALHNMTLFDPKTGKPRGNGLGDIFDHQILALPEYQFDSAGVYNFRIEQYMRMDTLPEILSVGVRIEKAAK
jgi:gliding motility-associated lipoprotein GldH